MRRTNAYSQIHISAGRESAIYKPTLDKTARLRCSGKIACGPFLYQNVQSPYSFPVHQIPGGTKHRVAQLFTIIRLITNGFPELPSPGDPSLRYSESMPGGVTSPSLPHISS